MSTYQDKDPAARLWLAEQAVVRLLEMVDRCARTSGPRGLDDIDRRHLAEIRPMAEAMASLEAAEIARQTAG
jgi:hypothetical protein